MNGHSFAPERGTHPAINTPSNRHRASEKPTRAATASIALAIAALGTGCIFTQPAATTTAPTGTTVVQAPQGSGGDTSGGVVYNSSSSGTVVAQPTGNVQPTGSAQATSGPPGQWSLTERQYWAALQRDMDVAVARMNTACGSNITFQYIHETFRGLLTEGGTYGMVSSEQSRCAEPVEALRDLCLLGATEQQAVRNGIRGIECAHGPRSTTMSNGIARTVGNPQQGPVTSSGYRNDFREFIGRNI